MIAENRVATLIEALPYIQRFHDKIIVVKCSGNAMVDQHTQSSFARDVVLLKQVGLHPVVVHGGGPAITQRLEAAKVKTRFVCGIRATDTQTMNIVDACLCEINHVLCDAIRSFGGSPLSLADNDRVVRAHKLKLPEAAHEDLGYAGTVAGIKAVLLEHATSSSIPILSPVGEDDQGVLYNVNADLAAAGVAAHLQAEKLILMTNTRGVLNADGELVISLSFAHVEKWIEEGVIQGGMIPKIRCAFNAIAAGVHAAHIIDGRKQHALLLELLTDAGVGTLIAKDPALLTPTRNRTD